MHPMLIVYQCPLTRHSPPRSAPGIPAAGGRAGWWFALLAAALLLAGCSSQPTTPPEEAFRPTTTAAWSASSPTATAPRLQTAEVPAASPPTVPTSGTTTPEAASSNEKPLITTTGAEQANTEGGFAFTPPAGWQLKTEGARSEILQRSEQGSISILLMSGALDVITGGGAPGKLPPQSPEAVIDAMVGAVDDLEMVGQQETVKIGGATGRAVDLVGVVQEEAVMGRLAAALYTRGNEKRAFVAFGIATGGAWERANYDTVLASVYLTRSEHLELTAADLDPLEVGTLHQVTDPSGMITIQQPVSGTRTMSGSPGEVFYRWQTDDARAGVVLHIRKEMTPRPPEELAAQLREKLHRESFATAGSYLVENLPIEGRVELDYGGRGVAADGTGFALTGRAWIYQVDDRLCEMRIYAPSARFEQLWQETFSTIYQSVQLDAAVPFPERVYNEVSGEPALSPDSSTTP